MGPNILLSMTQAISRPSHDNFPGYTHTDGGESLRMTRVSETSQPIAMKAMYLLTDVTGKDGANLTVFPGSHTRQIPRHSERVMTPYSHGAKQLMGRAGDVYLFPHSLWHGPSRNLSGMSRKVLLYNYCQLQRRLLGDLGYEFRPGSYFYVPKDQKEVILNPGED